MNSLAEELFPVLFLSSERREYIPKDSQQKRFLHELAKTLVGWLVDCRDNYDYYYTLFVGTLQEMVLEKERRLGSNGGSGGDGVWLGWVKWGFLG
ncbi:hypothetical protein M0804_007588 [Polistes exclamans]|nr:hypothetical protein M0804_007588 [Polistes exclamans]